jgi:hypothetical protein
MTMTVSSAVGEICLIPYLAVIKKGRMRVVMRVVKREGPAAL